MKKRALVFCVLAVLWLAVVPWAMAATQVHLVNYLTKQVTDLDQGQAAAMGGAGALFDKSSAQAGATSWYWYYDVSNYRLYMPGTSAGPDAGYLSWARAIYDYLPDAYSAASSVLGYDNSGYGRISAWLTSDSSRRDTLGWYYEGMGSNSIYINLAGGYSASTYGGTVAHETTHLLFDHKTNLYSRDPVADSWVTEALAYYVDRSVFSSGLRAGFSYNSALLNFYSNDGANRASWYESGARYSGRGGYSGMTTLDYIQLNTIGYFLANFTRGWAAIQDTVNYLAQGRGIDDAFSLAYGYATGQMSSASGPEVNTLYSKYINYYLGHY